MMVRRRCVVCARHVRRSDWRVTRVLLGSPVPGRLGLFFMRSQVAHRGCVVVSDASLERFVGGAR